MDFLPEYYNKLFWGISLILAFFLRFYFQNQASLNLNSLDTFLIFLFVFNLGIIGAKTSSVIESLLLKYTYIHPKEIISHSGGRIYGALFLVFFVFILHYIKYHKENTLKVLDIISLIFCLVKGIGDLGCQFSGDGCYGIQTNLPWGMDYHWGLYPAGYMAHPTPVYNFIFHTLFFFVLVKVHRHKQFIGQVSALYLGGIGFYHFFLELIRVNMPVWGPFSLSHFFYFTFFVASFPLYFCFKKGNYIHS